MTLTKGLEDFIGPSDDQIAVVSNYNWDNTKFAIVADNKLYPDAFFLANPADESVFIKHATFDTVTIEHTTIISLTVDEIDFDAVFPEESMTAASLNATKPIVLTHSGFVPLLSSPVCAMTTSNVGTCDLTKVLNNTDWYVDPVDGFKASDWQKGGFLEWYVGGGAVPPYYTTRGVLLSVCTTSVVTGWPGSAQFDVSLSIGYGANIGSAINMAITGAFATTSAATFFVPQTDTSHMQVRSLMWEAHSPASYFVIAALNTGTDPNVGLAKIRWISDDDRTDNVDWFGKDSYISPKMTPPPGRYFTQNGGLQADRVASVYITGGDTGWGAIATAGWYEAHYQGSWTYIRPEYIKP